MSWSKTWCLGPCYATKSLEWSWEQFLNHEQTTISLAAPARLSALSGGCTQQRSTLHWHAAKGDEAKRRLVPPAAPKACFHFTVSKTMRSECINFPLDITCWPCFFNKVWDLSQTLPWWLKDAESTFAPWRLKDQFYSSSYPNLFAHSLACSWRALDPQQLPLALQLKEIHWRNWKHLYR